MVYQGDKALGVQHYSEYSASYTPDVIKLDNDDDDSLPEISEIKNYSPIINKNTAKPAVTMFNGGTHLLGNTEERLKHKVLGVPRRRGAPSMGPYNHREGSGYVPYHRGDYYDAIEKERQVARAPLGA